MKSVGSIGPTWSAMLSAGRRASEGSSFLLPTTATAASCYVNRGFSTSPMPSTSSFSGPAHRLFPSSSTKAKAKTRHDQYLLKRGVAGTNIKQHEDEHEHEHEQQQQHRRCSTSSSTSLGGLFFASSIVGAVAGNKTAEEQHRHGDTEATTTTTTSPLPLSSVQPSGAVVTGLVGTERRPQQQQQMYHSAVAGGGARRRLHHHVNGRGDVNDDEDDRLGGDQRSVSPSLSSRGSSSSCSSRAPSPTSETAGAGADEGGVVLDPKGMMMTYSRGRGGPLMKHLAHRRHHNHGRHSRHHQQLDRLVPGLPSSATTISPTGTGTAAAALPTAAAPILGGNSSSMTGNSSNVAVATAAAQPGDNSYGNQTGDPDLLRRHLLDTEMMDQARRTRARLRLLQQQRQRKTRTGADDNGVLSTTTVSDDGLNSSACWSGAHPRTWLDDDDVINDDDYDDDAISRGAPAETWPTTTTTTTIPKVPPVDRYLETPLSRLYSSSIFIICTETLNAARSSNTLVFTAYSSPTVHYFLPF